MIASDTVVDCPQAAMKSQIIRPREDFGRHVRTQFELSEAGENNLVLDELQYQLDILFGKGASLDTKVSSLNSIVKIFTSELPIGAQKLLRNGANDLLLQVSSCLEEDKLSASAIALILAISSDNDGSFDPSLPVPVEMLSKLVGCVVIDEPMKHCVCRDSSAPPVGDHQCSDVSADNTGFRKKRKFGASVSLITAPSGDLPFVVRQYGSAKSVSSNPDSQSFGPQSSQAFSAAGDAQSDDYWTEQPQDVSVLSAVAFSAAPIAAPVAPVATGPGGFHRKRKMGSGTALAAVPVSTTALPVVTPNAHSLGSSSHQTIKRPAAAQSVVTFTLRERFNTLFCTFLCDKADSSQHTRTCASTLHMVLLNRYLSARVAALASVKTDMFLSSDNTDPQDPHQEEESTKASTQRTELTTQQQSQQQQDSGLGGGAKYQAQAEALGALQSCLRSNQGNRGSYLGKLCEEVQVLCTNCTTKKERVSVLHGSSTTSSGSRKKHAACAERTSLGALWLALGILDSACFRCPQNQSYLAGYVLWQTEEQDTFLPHTLFSFLQHLTPQLLLQVQDSHRAELAQRAAKQQAQAQQTAAQAASVVPSPGQVGRFGTPIVGNGTNNRGGGTHGSAGVCSTGRGSTASGAAASNQPMLPAEWEKFRNLFPEIPVLVSHKSIAPVVAKSAADTSSSASQNALWQDEDVLCLSSPQKTPNKNKTAPPLTPGSTTETEKEVRAVVGLQEVCTAALKTLVSLSNDCEEIAHALVHSSHSPASQASTHSSRLSSPLGTQGSQHTVPTSPAQARDVVSWAVAMLAWCAAWRCSLAASDGAHSSETRHKKDRLPQRRGVSGALSPDETALERFVFDLMLYLQSFLTNLAEFAPDAIADVTVWPCLCAYDIFQYLPEKSTETTSHTTYLSEKCPLLSHILDCKSPRAFGSPASTPAGKAGVRAQVKSMRLPDLLVEVLHLEAMDFLVDLEETDEAINQQMGQQGQGPMSPQPQSLSQQSPLKLKDASPPSGKANTPTQFRAKPSKSSSADEGNMPVPVAELIVSAHAALLLHTLTLTAAAPNVEEENHRRCIEDVASPARATPSQSQLTPVGFQQVVALQRAQRRKGLAARVRAQLPRGSWWLCVRVLKAFLTLQGQTGIMLLENLSPVLAAVQSMSRQDNPEYSLGTTSSTTMTVKLIEGKYDSPETQQRQTQAPANASLSKNNSNKRAIDLTADMPGKIDFLDLWAEDAPPAKKAATSGDKSAGEWVWNGNDYVWQAPPTPGAKTTTSSPPPVAPAALAVPVAPVSTAAAPHKPVGVSMSRTASSASVDSLYKSSFKPRVSVTSTSVSASPSASAATGGTKSLSRASSTSSSQGTKHTTAPTARKNVALSAAPKEAVALPRTSLSSARRFSASDDEEEESSHLWSSAAAARLERVPIRASPQKDGPRTQSEPNLNPKITSKVELSLKHAKASAEGAASCLNAPSEAGSDAAAASAGPVPKESGGWRSKRKTFGAPVKAVEAPPQSWFE